MRFKLLLTMLLVSSAFLLRAQNQATYVISKTVEYDRGKLDLALQKCSLNNYRQADHRMVMHFKDGSTVALLATQELANTGHASSTQYSKVDLKSTFILTPEGYIMEEVKMQPTLDEQKHAIAKKTAKQ